jgi:hypothetical protein
MGLSIKKGYWGEWAFLAKIYYTKYVFQYNSKQKSRSTNKLLRRETMPQDGEKEWCNTHRIYERWCEKHNDWEYYCSKCQEWRIHSNARIRHYIGSENGRRVEKEEIECACGKFLAWGDSVDHPY